ncbi:MAG: hypothetical protein R2856_22530 [Caldilineaceae bacterium]
MNSRDRVLTALRRGQPDRVPWVEGGVDLPMQRKLMGRSDFLPEELNETLGLDNLIADFVPPIFAEVEVHDDVPFPRRTAATHPRGPGSHGLPQSRRPRLLPPLKNSSAATMVATPWPPRCGWAHRPRCWGWGWKGSPTPWPTILASWTPSWGATLIGRSR